ncbi:probable protein phosphatase 2C 24 isoform X1 [Ziziphus jujuba]|uniref:protein-serine/threonine phosphatase n=1 Tax=Ziziphus jujuba TaxID=326968 RepID=A0ABM3ZU57_ZIZJJ|nr:probable protein phosphatase 2C 24 isoform X1 [Ziziphus jujuba]
MAEICCGVISENETSPPCETRSRAARRRRMEIRKFKYVAGVSPQDAVVHNGQKRPKVEDYEASLSRDCLNAVENCSPEGDKQLVKVETGRSMTNKIPVSGLSISVLCPTPSVTSDPELLSEIPKFGVASVCGRRRDMEDAVAICPSFCRGYEETTTELHYYGVYDGHGCSHVATRCRERLHELVKEELESKEEASSKEWKSLMERSFSRMDKEVIAWNESMVGANCRCELQTPECDAVGSTAVVAIVTPEKIIVANCGDSRAVLCRNGRPIPLSSDHKPDRPDELNRIQAAGGRVIYWEGPRVLGVLAMSRAIGDNYLKPYVTCEPEVTITDRTAEDDCLILASDGLWDVVSNDTACGVARMCLRGKAHAPPLSPSLENEVAGLEISDKACSDASMLLTKLALARRSTDNFLLTGRFGLSMVGFSFQGERKKKKKQRKMGINIYIYIYIYGI